MTCFFYLSFLACVYPPYRTRSISRNVRIRHVGEAFHETLHIDSRESTGLDLRQSARPASGLPNLRPESKKANPVQKWRMASPGIPAPHLPHCGSSGGHQEGHRQADAFGSLPVVSWSRGDCFGESWKKKFSFRNPWVDCLHLFWGSRGMEKLDFFQVLWEEWS